MSDREYINTGIVSSNRKKRPGHKDPDITGQLENVACPHCAKSADYWLSGWAKEGRNGKFYGLSVKPKDAPAETRPAPQYDEDIPF